MAASDNLITDEMVAKVMEGNIYQSSDDMRGILEAIAVEIVARYQQPRVIGPSYDHDSDWPGTRK